MTPPDRRRRGQIGLLVAAVVGALALARLWPKLPREQTVHYVLGDAAQRVEEIEASWAEPESEDFAREVRFRYAKGAAPRVVTHEPRLRDGDYTVEIQIIADAQRTVVWRHVVLGGGATSIDLASSVPGPANASPRIRDTEAR
jgi:hypothetical protein